MASKHMNLKRISHRIKEEVGSTVEVANVVGVRGAFATFRVKWIFKLWFIMDI